MAKVVTDDQNYINIANTIRERAGTEDTYTPSRMPEGIEKVYEAGQADKEDEFWNAITANGTRTNYQMAFCNWSIEYIRPMINGQKFKIQPTSSNSFNQICNGCRLLKKIEADYFDFSNIPRATTSSGGCYYTFHNCKSLEEVEDIGLNNIHSYTNTFANCSLLHTIANIGVDEDTYFVNAFSYCNSLVNLGITGIIGQGVNKFDLSYSKNLSKASIENVFRVLSTETSGLSITLSKEAVNNAFGIDVSDVATYPEGSEYYNLLASRSNWTINYA